MLGNAGPQVRVDPPPILEVVVENAWKVIWIDHAGKKYFRNFDGEKPRESGAIDFGKKLKAQGFHSVDVVSKRRAFAPPPGKSRPPSLGLLWCPYCLKWREFVFKSIRRGTVRTPVAWRCPVCSISTEDHFVKRFNFMEVARLDEAAVKVPKTSKLRRSINSGNNKVLRVRRQRGSRTS
jgi:hypothetical protein